MLISFVFEYHHLCKSFSLGKEVEKLGDHLLAASWVYMSFIEHTSLLKHQALLNTIEGRIFNCIRSIIIPDQ